MSEESDIEDTEYNEDIGDYQEEELDETSTEFVDQLVMKLIVFTEEFCNVTLFPYQVPIAYRIIESIVLGDGEEITVSYTHLTLPTICSV